MGSCAPTVPACRMPDFDLDCLPPWTEISRLLVRFVSLVFLFLLFLVFVCNSPSSCLHFAFLLLSYLVGCALLMPIVFPNSLDSVFAVTSLFLLLSLPCSPAGHQPSPAGVGEWRPLGSQPVLLG